MIKSIFYFLRFIGLWSNRILRWIKAINEKYKWLIIIILFKITLYLRFDECNELLWKIFVFVFGFTILIYIPRRNVKYIVKINKFLIKWKVFLYLYQIRTGNIGNIAYGAAIFCAYILYPIDRYVKIYLVHPYSGDLETILEKKKDI